MRRTFLLLFCLAVVYSGYSQAYEITDLNTLSDQFNFERNEMKDIDALYEKIEGSPFLNEDFVPGDVVINDSVTIEEIPLRYDIYRDRIQFLDKRDQVLEIDLSKPITFYFDDRSFVICDYKEKAEEKRGVLELLVEGRIRLYKKYNIEFKKATKAIGFRDAQPNMFNRREAEYFISVDNGIPEKINKKKSLIRKLKDLNPEVEDYLENRKLRLRKENELVQLIQFCNKR
ncbi:MAG: hypothetical protein R6U46_06785 [Marinilabilia sp.]